MSPRRAARAWLLTALVVLLAAEAHAHQQKESITRVLFNTRTGNIEVMHRFLVHDAEHAMAQLLRKPVDLMGSETDRLDFANYVHGRFSLRDQAGLELPLTPIGHELDGKYLWVYSETAQREDLSSLTITHGALREVWPEQSNLVNIERNGEVSTALLAGNSREITVPL